MLIFATGQIAPVDLCRRCVCYDLRARMISKPPEGVPEQRSVWIVDDSPLEAEMARQALGSECRTQLFSDGSALLEQMVTAPPPDVLVLDWVMPGVSGIDVCKF